MIRRPENDPVRKASFMGASSPPVWNRMRRSGRPRKKWLDETYTHIWTKPMNQPIQALHDNYLRTINQIAQKAKDREPPF